jgi:hypothetical protein
VKHFEAMRVTACERVAVQIVLPTSVHNLQSQYPDAYHHAADDTQMTRIELSHLFGHALPGSGRSEQK